MSLKSVMRRRGVIKVYGRSIQPWKVDSSDEVFESRTCCSLLFKGWLVLFTTEVNILELDSVSFFPPFKRVSISTYRNCQGFLNTFFSSLQVFHYSYSMIPFSRTPLLHHFPLNFIIIRSLIFKNNRNSF